MPSFTEADVYSPRPGSSEDCLFLDVLVPEMVFNQKKTARVPVVVFIHGGGFVQGSKTEYGSGVGLLNAAAQNDQELIYVSINYRLGLFVSTDRLKYSQHTIADIYDTSRALLLARTLLTFSPISDSRIRCLRCNISRIIFTSLVVTQVMSLLWDSQQEQDRFFTILLRPRFHLFHYSKKPLCRAPTRTSFQYRNRKTHFTRFYEPRMCLRGLIFSLCPLRLYRLQMVSLWVTLGLTAHLDLVSTMMLSYNLQH
jgi:hypothetical protein